MGDVIESATAGGETVTEYQRGDRHVVTEIDVAESLIVIDQSDGEAIIVTGQACAETPYVADWPIVYDERPIDTERSCVMKLEKRVIQICQASAMKHIRDIEAALDEAKRKLKLPVLPKWIATLVDNALREQIHWARQISNKKLKKAAGEYGGPAKVGTSSALNDLAESVWQDSIFNHTICGWLLGDIEKVELPYFAEVEDEKAAGSAFNAEICRAIYQLCLKRKGKTVRECLTEDELLKLFKRIKRNFGRDAA